MSEIEPVILLEDRVRRTGLRLGTLLKESAQEYLRIVATGGNSYVAQKAVDEIYAIEIEIAKVELEIILAELRRFPCR